MSSDAPRELAVLDRAYRVLAEATSVEEVKAVRDKAEAARSYAKAARLGLDVQNRAAEVKLCAERRAGRLLASLRLRGGDRRSNGHAAQLKLADLGVSYDQSKRWQHLASVPEDEFRKYLRTTSEQRREISSAHLLRIARESQRRLNSSGCQLTGRFSGRREANAILHKLIQELVGHCQLLVEIFRPKGQDGPHLIRRTEKGVIDELLSEMDALLQQLKHEAARF